MTTYAGEVRIKTKLDASGINEGMKKVSAQLAGIAKTVAIGMAVGVAAVVAGVAMAAGAIFKIFKDMSKMQGFKQQLAEVNLAFANLKNVAYSALMPLFNALLPMIMQIVDWLTMAANVAAAFFAKLTGSATYMVYVASSLAGVDGSSGSYADNMERAEKAAKGATASFDKLNVLQQEPENEQEPGAGGGSGGAGQWVVKDVEDTLSQVEGGWKSFIDGLIQGFKDGDWSGLNQWFLDYVWQPITDWAAEKINKIASFFSETWEKIKQKAIEVWDTLKTNFQENIWEPIKQTFTEIWESIKLEAIEIWNSVKEKWAEASQFFTDLWTGIKEGAVEKWDSIVNWIQTAVENIKQFFVDLGEKAAALWQGIKDKVAETWESIKEAWANAGAWFNEKVLIPIRDFFTEKWDAIKTKVTDIWEGIKEAWQNAKDWFSDTVLNPIKDAFTTIWQGISDTIKGIINGIIGFINGMIQGIVNGVNAVIGVLNTLNFKIPDWVPGLGGESFGFSIAAIEAPQIPYLATGAVIPPNAPFAAILGDQKSGRNIEAPESLLRQIVRDEMRGMNSQPQTIHNVLKLDGRVVYESWDKENRRVGSSLISKGAAA